VPVTDPVSVTIGAAGIGGAGTWSVTSPGGNGSPGVVIIYF
jgi:hypothetical protein